MELLPVQGQISLVLGFVLGRLIPSIRLLSLLLLRMDKLWAWRHTAVSYTHLTLPTTSRV